MKILKWYWECIQNNYRKKLKGRKMTCQAKDNSVSPLMIQHIYFNDTTHLLTQHIHTSK